MFAGFPGRGALYAGSTGYFSNESVSMPSATGTSAARAHIIFDGPGEMRALCRALDWAATPLGDPATWSCSLCTCTHMVLSSPRAIFLYWGPELVQIFNDAHRRSLGEGGQRALGMRARDFWDAQVWSTIGPEIEGVMTRGEVAWHEDEYLPIERNGRRADVWWTYGFSPVLDDDGSIGGCIVVGEETTARVLAERALRVEHARLADVFRHAPAFLAVVRGPTHVLELANDSFLELVGRDRGIIGKPLFDSVPELEAQGYLERLTDVRETGVPFLGHEVPALLERTPGAPPEEHFFDFTYVPLVEANGVRVGVIAHGTSVTAYVLARREVERLLAESQASAHRRDDFLGIVSHDLGNLASAITMGAHALAIELSERSVPRSMLRMVSLIESSSISMMRLIEDLLNVAAIEAGRLTLELSDEAPADLVARAADLYTLRAGESEVALKTRALSDLPLIRVDAERLLQALGNLVANALKFTDPGGRVTIRAGRADGGVRFAVEDTGAGIAPEELPHVFDRFWKKRRGRGRQGAGLGLAIVRGIVEGHGGTVAVRSKPGEGSRFSFTIPC